MNSILPISVLIPTMNRPDSLERTLKKYICAKYIPAQIVVVDQSEEKARNRTSNCKNSKRNF